MIFVFEFIFHGIHFKLMSNVLHVIEVCVHFNDDDDDDIKLFLR